jgi:molybdopterin converting factor small subunit
VTVQVKLFASLTKFLPANAKRKAATINVPDPATVGTILQQLNIPEGVTAVLLVNGRQAKVDTELSADDTVSIFPPVAGGRP